ncbi:DNA alkylation repair protein [Paenibacillus tyrfis]|uniref:DNA alkylation repair protein n=1 Tax=Paenibacillus tyrfis TaxID=1501230 RepID=UPI00248FD03D|nr:DNA alkylation repair protein [Paenibacillus tyrfis]GLI05070.1 DNA alkylation repair protein [Paenibacillus tyrfis]
MDQEKTVIISDVILQRKGARKAADIPEAVIQLLQRGELQTVNLTEWLAIDHLKLLRHVLCTLELHKESDEMLSGLERLNQKKIMSMIPAIARKWLSLLDHVPEKENTRIFHALADHRSDSMRCWAAYMIGLDERLMVMQKLTGIRPFAADSHFGVREMAWMAVRESISNELLQALDILREWVCDEHSNIRRFAVESLRPQGVWAKHLSVLKEQPQLALSLLEEVKSDPVNYVQDSVGNWLNDAGKTNPNWVRRICDAWLEASDTKETKRIVARATEKIKEAGALS